MRVIKRSGRVEDVKFNKVTNRITKLTYDLSENVDVSKVAQQVFSSMYDEIKTHEIDTLSSEVCIGMITSEPDYEVLATRIVASNIQKRASNNFHIAMRKLHKAGIVTHEVLEVSSKVKDNIEHERDFDFGYFGLKTLEKGYLQKIDGDIIETPQYLYMRVSIGIHGHDIDRVLETYEAMSKGLFIHATPTLFNAGTHRPQMSSCFLIANKEDSIDGIYNTVKECAQISKWAGGIGLHIHDVRANKSHIRGTNGTSDGIIPMLRVYNSTARYVNQAGRRKGSIAVYLEPWHTDILDFLEIRLNQGDEEARCRDLFTAMWIPDLFMKRVERGEKWSLFCPDKARGLSDVYGKEFEDLYEKYESEGLASKVVPATDIWKSIIKSQSETGTPYMLYKDACNEKSNHKHVGTIKSSNLCTEILEYTDKDETAVCNLASIALPKYVNPETKEFDHEELHRVTKMVTRNLNRVIDKNFYPTETGKNSNMRHRPIGIGVQGLADVFIMCRMVFGSEESRKLNRDIFETIYHASLESSCELAEMYGTYETFKGSPFSKGILQFDMWDRDPQFSGRYDWDVMRERVKEGTRNSLLLAPMPTASTSQILGNNECFEPYTTNIYLRRTLAGEFVVVNKHLVKDLKKIGLWSKEMKDLMVKANGSVQNIIDIPDDLKELYKTVWEMSQKTIIDMAADRGVYIDQSQSMNLFVESPTISKLSSMHMYAWKTGLKTGMYYLRSKAKARPIQFSLEAECAMCSA
ncbi:MAG: ribonucleoside-diphosphate reductase [Prasinovirus sp.]|nr:MAG: ribonucleoside-diphosphate reductase [Prasinovirus sp.]|tara:strand:- start:510 stop:2756 length:2247 start_codon:yes stop_codon:yes gene_type:complete